MLQKFTKVLLNYNLVHSCTKMIDNLGQKEHFLPKSFCNIRVNCIFVYNFGVVMTEEEKSY